MIDLLKKTISGFIESEDMRNYLTDNAESLAKWQILDMICYSRKSVYDKYEALKAFAEYETGTEDDCSYKKAVDEAVYVINEMNVNSGEVLLMEMWSDQGDCIFTEPYLSFDKAFGEIKKNYDEGDDSCYYIITKYRPNRCNEFDTVCCYYAFPDGTISLADYPYSKHLDFTNGAGLNLPVPFKVGNIVTIDCTPFAEIKHGVILQIGDNRDCCSVQCACVYEDSIIVGALKHPTMLLGKYTEMSALYRAEKFNGELPKEEKILKIIAEYVGNDEMKGKAFWDAVCSCEQDGMSVKQAEEYFADGTLEKKAREKFIQCNEATEKLADE